MTFLCTWHHNPFIYWTVTCIGENKMMSGDFWASSNNKHSLGRTYYMFHRLRVAKVTHPTKSHIFIYQEARTNMTIQVCSNIYMSLCERISKIWGGNVFTKWIRHFKVIRNRNLSRHWKDTHRLDEFSIRKTTVNPL